MFRTWDSLSTGFSVISFGNSKNLCIYFLVFNIFVRAALSHARYLDVLLLVFPMCKLFFSTCTVCGKGNNNIEKTLLHHEIEWDSSSTIKKDLFAGEKWVELEKFSNFILLFFNSYVSYLNFTHRVQFRRFDKSGGTKWATTFPLLCFLFKGTFRKSIAAFWASSIF